MIQYPHITASEALEQDVLARKGFDLEPEQGKAERGQVLLMFALFMTAMLGILGLAMDVGYASAQRRVMQNAADLSAQAGALSVASYNDSNQISAMTSVIATLNGNQTHEGAPALERCQYTDTNENTIGACDNTVPSNATGVIVQVRETHRTFFMRAIPGGPEYVTTRAKAAAQVNLLRQPGMDSPFIVCGYDTKRMDGSEQSILSSNDMVNPAAIGRTFRLMGTGTSIANCGLSGVGASSWRGLAENQYSAPNNNGKQINGMWLGRIGSSPGAIKFNVTGVTGCKQGAGAPYGTCVMLLPIAINGAHGTAPVKPLGAPPQFFVSKVLAFQVSACGANCYQGILLDDYPVFGAADPGWCRDCGGTIVIKLVDA